MKPLFIIVVIALLGQGCEKINIDVNNPDVSEFVRQLKNGTYDQFEWTEDGERLWAIMPSFDKDDVQALITLAGDTKLVSPCDHFPVNPLSSIPPCRINNGEESIMIGEFLLWCAEAAIEGKDYASLIPVLYSSENPDSRLPGNDILAIRDIYQEWWDSNSQTENPVTLPLTGTVYSWR